MTATATFQREVFATSRALEFFTEKELTMQIGHNRPRWPVALLKELIDNALDACESAEGGPAPEIEVVLDPDSVSVQDNGPGLPEHVLRRSLDYEVRVSDKAFYVSPTRGQLGNALKCVYAAPFVVTGDSGRVDVEANGCRRTVEVTLDRIAQKPEISLGPPEPSVVKTGSLVRMHWPRAASKLTHGPGVVRFLQQLPVPPGRRSPPVCLRGF
jgi:DNA topoisomerase VI subunit B